jgi:CubicO group peptidase (beta-lactamase class C family)
VFMATLTLRCVEDGQLSLDDRVSQYNPDSADTVATLRQLLTHTSGPPDNLVFTYRPDRLDSLAAALAACKNLSFREFISTFFDRLAMRDSVPGPDVLASPPTADGWPDGAALARYSSVLDRLATPYVTAGKTVRRSAYTATTLTPASGVISTVDDFAQFDLALKNGLLLRSDTIAQAWQAPVNRSSQRLPHGIGWFVQGYHGELLVWQFGISDAGSSSLVLEVPGRGVTLVLLANSSALVKPYPLAAGDVTVSPFAKLFLGLVVP